MASKGSIALHTIQPVEIIANGSKAFAQSVGSIAVRFHHEGADYELVSACRFLSRLQQAKDINGTSPCWKMLSIEMIYMQDSIFPVAPESISNDPEYLSPLANRRKSYQGLSWALEKKGYATNDELPGLDDEESVAKVLLQDKEWLSSQ